MDNLWHPRRETSTYQLSLKIARSISPEKVHGRGLAAVDAIHAKRGARGDEDIERPGLEATVVVVAEAANTVLHQHERRT